MAGYAARARIGRVAVHPAGARRGGLPTTRPAERQAPGSERPVEPPPDDAGRMERLLDDLRTTWAQTTFYLFDPQSWR